jgi:ubiquinol-cytochrome c reductase cytochrome c1 subunit
MFRKIAISAVSALTLFTGAAWAEGEIHTEDVAFSFEGPFGKFEEHQLQRGLQVFTEVCSACHGLKYLRIGALADVGGPHLPEEQVKAYAKALTVIDAETGEERTATPADHFPANTGAAAPDLSVMAKARKGFSGPYGLGTNQLFKGMGGPEHIYSVLTGYTGEEKEVAGVTFYENHAFAGGWIAMPPPLSADLVAYADGTETSVENYSEDVSAFLMWAAEPKMMVRKQSGFKAVLLLGLLSVLLYLTNKRLWAGVKGKKKTA